MTYQLDELTASDPSDYSPDQLRERIEKLLHSDSPRYRRLWGYYRNPMRVCGVSDADTGSQRPYRQAQEWGLPSRITGMRSGAEIFSAQPIDQVSRKEVVIENDIG